jgi:hypothetical protein
MTHFLKNSKILTLLFGSLTLGTQAQTVDKVNDPVEWINPLMGTASKPSLLQETRIQPLLCLGG